MWALIEKDTNIVIACIVEVTYEEAIKIAGDNILIEMNLDNSPAYLKGTWDGNKFYPEKQQIEETV
jgi:hypothetical protein